jgi:bacterioferritin (cytochrome b1)
MVERIGEPREFNSDDLTGQTTEYAMLKKSIEHYEARQKELKASLFAKIEADGFEDDKGNLWLELPEPVEGYVSLQKQKRVTRKIDEMLAEDLIEKKGLADRLYKTVRVVDEDELMAALYEGLLTEEEVDEMFPAKIVWALMLSKK